MNQAFDFEAHGRTAAKNYEKIFFLYERYADAVKQILRASIPSDYPIHSIERRAKSVENFERKASKPDESDPSKPKYPTPLQDITDSAGVRVITFFPKTIKEVNLCIDREFEVLWNRDIGEDLLQFGYRSIHYLVKLKQARADLPEYKEYKDMVAEIQVRTILQHAWAEMEHDIQYKSVEQNTLSIQRRFIALAGMLEIADREFQAIQDEDSSLRSAVRASLQDDFTKTTIANLTKAAEGTSDMAEVEKGPREIAKAIESIAGWNPTRARELVVSGKYIDAISLYYQMIEAQPNSHTLYIGLAKAKFLAGDRTGALADIKTAIRNFPNDSSILNLKRQMEDGNVILPNVMNEAWQLSASGNVRLSEGQGEEAFKFYSEAQSIGFNFAFSTFNKAMACVLIKDIDGATYFLDQLNAPRGTPMEINAMGIRAIVAVITNLSADTALKQLTNRRNDAPEYDFQQSPLRHLEAGLKQRDTKIDDRLVKVFNILKGKHIPNNL